MWWIPIILFLIWWWYPRKPSLPEDGYYYYDMKYYRIRFKNDQVKIFGNSGWIPLKEGNHRLTKKGLWLRKKNAFIHKRGRYKSIEECCERNYYPIEPYEIDIAVIHSS